VRRKVPDEAAEADCQRDARKGVSRRSCGGMTAGSGVAADAGGSPVPPGLRSPGSVRFRESGSIENLCRIMPLSRNLAGASEDQGAGGADGYHAGAGDKIYKTALVRQQSLAS